MRLIQLEGRNCYWLSVAIVLLGMIATPALGFSVSYISGDSGGTVISSGSYSLDDSSSLQQQAVLSGSEISQTSQASGTGNNAIEGSAGGSGHFVSHRVDSSGSMAVLTKTVATGSGACISQGISLSGSSGDVSMIASSDENSMGLASSFSGGSSMNTDLSAVAAEGAYMTGTATIAGVPVLEKGDLERISSGEIGMSVDGLYTQPTGDQGEFSLSAVNIKKSSSSSSPALLTGPSYTDNSIGGSPSSCRLAGWRWNTYNPTIKWYVKSNTVPTALGAANAMRAVSNAVSTWNSASNQKLFNPVVYSSSSVKIDAYDRNNVVAWKYLKEAPSALAYSRTWYSYSKKGGYYSAVESDLSFNTRYAWSTSLKDGTAYRSGNAIDVETVVLHEMGHTLGLLDLYNLPSSDPRRADTKQAMNSYNDVQRTLGNGDKTGVWALYG